MNDDHYIVMFFIMIISGLFSTMNVYVDKYDDIRFNLNDIYMVFLMTGWMFFFMGIFYKNKKILLVGLALVITTLWAIRTQFMITDKQYLLGMIPHHSMAIHMSKKLLEKNTKIKDFLIEIINKQSQEIIQMKKQEGVIPPYRWGIQLEKVATVRDQTMSSLFQNKQ